MSGRLLRLYERYIERDRGLADVPWKAIGPDAWSKARGRMSATVSLSPRGDGSYVVTSVLNVDGMPRRTQLPCRDHAEALAQAEALKLKLDARAV